MSEAPPSGQSFIIEWHLSPENSLRSTRAMKNARENVDASKAPDLWSRSLACVGYPWGMASPRGLKDRLSHPGIAKDAPAAMRAALSEVDGTIGKWMREARISAHLREQWTAELVKAAEAAVQPVRALAEPVWQASAAIESRALESREAHLRTTAQALGMDGPEWSTASTPSWMTIKAVAGHGLSVDQDGLFTSLKAAMEAAMQLDDDGLPVALMASLNVPDWSPKARDAWRQEMLNTNQGSRAEEAWRWFGAPFVHPIDVEREPYQSTRVTHFMEALARDLAARWVSEAEVSLETSRRQRVPGMPRALVTALADAPRADIDQRKEGFQLTGEYIEERQVQLIPTAPNLDAILKLPELLRSAPVRRTVRHLVRTGWEQHVAEKHDARAVQFLGGWEGLRTKLGANRKQMKQVKEACEILQGARWEFPSLGMDGLGLWTVTNARGRDKRQRVLRFVLGDVLMPGNYLLFDGKSRAMRQARSIIPVLEEPVLVGRRNEAGAELALQDHLLVYIKDNAERYEREDGCQLPFEELASRVGLSSRLAERVADAWSDPDDGWLVRNGSRYRIKDEQTHEFVREAAKQRSRGRIRQRRAKDNRQKRNPSGKTNKS